MARPISSKPIASTRAGMVANLTRMGMSGQDLADLVKPGMTYGEIATAVTEYLRTRPKQQAPNGAGRKPDV